MVQFLSQAKGETMLFLALAVHDKQPHTTIEINAAKRGELMNKVKRELKSQKALKGYELESITENQTSKVVWVNGNWTNAARELGL